MHHDFLDKYSRLQSPVHRVPGEVKLAAALGVVVALVAVPRSCWWFFAGVGLLLVLATVAARIPLGFAGRRLAMLEPFVIGVALLAIFQPGGGGIALGMVVKSTLSLAVMILLANTTPFPSVLAVLRRVRVPALLITVLALMYRYLFVLLDEAERMRRARASRTFTARSGRRWRSLATLVGQLFVRSTARAERIYAAMGARGWQ